jgi:hypothetical protein
LTGSFNKIDHLGCCMDRQRMMGEARPWSIQYVRTAAQTDSWELDALSRCIDNLIDTAINALVDHDAWRIAEDMRERLARLAEEFEGWSVRRQLPDRRIGLEAYRVRQWDQKAGCRRRARNARSSRFAPGLVAGHAIRA